MKLVTPEQMRDLDRRTIEEYGTPGEMLMERAGYGVAEIVRRLAELELAQQEQAFFSLLHGSSERDIDT